MGLPACCGTTLASARWRQSCGGQLAGKALRAGRDRRHRLGATPTRRPADARSIPFSISVDGQLSTGAGLRPVDAQRRTDIGLSAIDIQVKFDGLDVEPVLNVVTIPTGAAVTRPARRSTSSRPPTIPAGSRGPRSAFSTGVRGPAPTRLPCCRSTSTAQPAGRCRRANADYSYVLRVYDRQGRFDETIPATSGNSPAEPSGRLGIADPAEDRTASPQHPGHGGAVTVYGAGCRTATA